MSEHGKKAIAVLVLILVFFAGMATSILMDNMKCGKGWLEFLANRHHQNGSMRDQNGNLWLPAVEADATPVLKK